MSEVHVWESSQIWRREDGAIVEDRQGKHYSSDPNEAFIHVVLLADYTALRAEVELLKVDLDETIKDSHKQLDEVERLQKLVKRARPYVQAYAAITRTDEVSLDASETAEAMRLSVPTTGSR